MIKIKEEIGLGRDQFNRLTHLVCLLAPYREIYLTRVEFRLLAEAIQKALEEEENLI